MKEERQAAVLAAYKETASVSVACKLAGVARTQHYEWLREDPEYKRRFADARIEATDLLVDEAVRRAHHGIDEPVVFQGRFTFEPLRNEKDELLRDDEGHVRFSDTPLCIRKYSDSMLVKLLQAWRPAEYRESWKGELSGPDGGPITLTEQGLRKLTDEQLAQLTELARLLAQSPDAGS